MVKSLFHFKLFSGEIGQMVPVKEVGVFALYVRNELQPVVISEPPDNIVESVFVKIKIGNKLILVGSISIGHLMLCLKTGVLLNYLLNIIPNSALEQSLWETKNLILMMNVRYLLFMN